MTTPSTGDAQVQDNQQRAAALGVNISGVGGAPTISATGLQDNPSPIQVPSAPPLTGGAALTGAIGSAQDYFKGLADKANSAQSNMGSSLSDLINAELGGGTAQFTNDAYKNAGVDTAQQQLNDVNQKITAEQEATNHQVQALKQNPQGFFGTGLDQEIQKVTDASTARQADLAIVQMAKQGAYDSAKAIADRVVAAKTEAQQNAINVRQQIYQANKDIFSTAEQQQFEAQQTKMQNELDTQKQETLAAYDQKIKQSDPLYQAQLASARQNAGLDVNGNPLPAGSGNVPSNLQPYYKTSYDGTPYVDLSTLSPSQKNQYAQIAAASGIKPILTAEDSDKISHIAVAKSNLNDIMDAFNAVPVTKDIPAAQGITNSIKNFFGNADIRAFQNYRTSAINTLQALAGGSGSGFRITQSEIGAAIQDIPVLTGPGADTPAQAQKKIDNLNAQIDKWQTQILGGGNHPSPSASSNDLTTPQEGDTRVYNGVTYVVQGNSWVPQ